MGEKCLSHPRADRDAGQLEGAGRSTEQAQAEVPRPQRILRVGLDLIGMAAAGRVVATSTLPQVAACSALAARPSRAIRRQRFARARDKIVLAAVMGNESVPRTTPRSSLMAARHAPVDVEADDLPRARAVLRSAQLGTQCFLGEVVEPTLGIEPRTPSLRVMCSAS